MKEVTITRIVKTESKKHYKLFLYKQANDYIYYASFCRWNTKTKKTSGKWMGLGCYTTLGHAIRGFSRLINEKVRMVK